jgi:hypothetical protein
VLRKSLDYTVDSFHNLPKKYPSAGQCGKLGVNLDAPGAAEKFFLDDFMNNVLSSK